MDTNFELAKTLSKELEEEYIEQRKVIGENPKSIIVEEELENQLAVLYGKTVPAGVREFLELKSGGTGTAPKQKRLKSVPSSAVGEKTGMNENG